ncbi:MAG TPA: hypothetical protein EYP19_11760, partial [Desulfobacterales bacterium]|nr:hypothetical protein [Desulfobacterales bacterium]
MALLPLVSGAVLIRHLSVDDATVSIVRRKDVPDGGFEPKKKRSNALIPIFESVSLRNVEVSLADADTLDLARLVLRNCSLKAGGNGDRLCLEGDGVLNSKEFEIEGQFGLLADMLTGDEPYPMDLNINAEGLCLNVSGTIDDPMRGQGLNVRVSGEQPELQDTLHLFRKDLPKLGRLTFDALVSGDLGAPIVSNLDLKVSGGSQLEFTAKGSMLDLRGDKESRILFSGTSSNKDLLRMFLPEEAPPVSIVNVEGAIRHRAGHYLFDDIRLHAAGDQGLRVTSSGSVAVSPEAKEGPILTLNLMTNVTAPQVGTAAPFLEKNHIAPLGPVEAKARVSGTNAFLSLDEIAIAAGKEDGVHVKCEGRVGRIPLSAGKRVSDVSIVSSVQAIKAPAFASLLGISFPDLGPLEGAFRFVEEEGTYAFKDIELVIGSRKSLWLKGLGSFNLDIEDGAASLGGLDVEVKASAPSLAAVPRAADLNLPDLKPLKLETCIVDPDGRLDILDIEAFKFEAGTGEDAFLRI